MTGAPGLAARDGRDIAILDAAVSVASVGGYEAVRMRAVAERAGIAVGSIYRRFPSKAYLLVCALTREVEQVEALRDWSAVPGGPQQRLVALSDCLHEQWQRDLPLTEALPDTTLTNAWFEMISAFTTTGASAYDPERLADSVHLWRATVGWFGGFLILLAAYAILAPLNLGGTEVSSGRPPGRSGIGSAQVGRTADPGQRLTRFALMLFPAYAALTVLLWCGLLILGERGISALLHAMGTLSTSGITGRTAFQASGAGVAGELLVFLCFAFALTRRALPGIRLTENRRPLLQDPELRLAALIILAVTLILFLRHWFVAGRADLTPTGQAFSALLAGEVQFTHEVLGPTHLSSCTSTKSSPFFEATTFIAASLAAPGLPKVTNPLLPVASRRSAQRMKAWTTKRRCQRCSRIRSPAPTSCFCRRPILPVTRVWPKPVG